jgi:hypothetical protein
MKDDMGWECSTHANYEKCIAILWLENFKRRDHLEDLGVDGG